MTHRSEPSVDFNACSAAEQAQMILAAAAKARGERAVQRPPRRPAVDFNDAQSVAAAICRGRPQSKRTIR